LPEILIAPSILNSDYAFLGHTIRRLEDGGADILHFDIMDGHFVPDISIGIPTIKSLRKFSKLFFDVHLMISRPLFYAEKCIAAGADRLTFHVEAEDDPREVIDEIRRLGCGAGLAVKPETPASAVFPYLDSLEQVLVMTVEPGMGGQSFMPDMLPKIAELRKKAPSLNIQVDGGINAQTALFAREAGANILVAGTAILNSADFGESIKSIRGKM
jgi:ribulose-phosphate 3-epimerase